MHRMTAPWLDSMTPVGPPAVTSPSMKNLLYAATLTGSWSAILCLVVYLIGRLLGVPFEVATSSGAALTVIPWLAVLLVPMAAAFAAALLGSLVRGQRAAGRIVFWLGTLVAAASCLVPILQPSGVYWSTRILLIAMHAITWLLVVPQIARIVGDSEPGKHVDANY